MKYISKKLYIFPALALLISLIAYPFLPEQIPIHFDFNGNPDNYSGKLFVLMIPIIMAALLVLADFLPKADPKSANYAKFPKAYQLLHVLVQLLLLVTHIVTVAYPILQMNGSLWGVTFVGSSFNTGFIIGPLVGIMLIIIGNYMPKFKQSYFCGIKTPWALADEENWYKTHRFGGKLWVLGGALMVIIPFLPESIGMILIFTDILILVVIPYLYSYLIYRKKSK